MSALLLVDVTRFCVLLAKMSAKTLYVSMSIVIDERLFVCYKEQNAFQNAAISHWDWQLGQYSYLRPCLHFK